MFVSTYARVTLALSPAISSLITKHARQTQTTRQPSVLPLQLLTETQVNQALSHPQNASLSHLIGTAYRDVTAAMHYINLSQEELDNQRDFIEAARSTLQAQLRKNSSPALQESIEKTKEALNQQLRFMTTLQKNTHSANQALAFARQEIDTLANKHDGEWSAFRKKGLQQLKNELKKLLEVAGFTLLPGEIDNLEREDMQEVIDRYIDLGADKDVPATIKKILALDKADPSTYFKMKAYMAIRSTLSSSTDRTRLMQQLNNFFTTTQRDAEQLNVKHTVENSSMQQKVAPTLAETKAIYTQLHALKQDSHALLDKVAALQEIRTKIEKHTEIKGPTLS